MHGRLIGYYLYMAGSIKTVWIIVDAKSSAISSREPPKGKDHYHVTSSYLFAGSFFLVWKLYMCVVHHANRSITIPEVMSIVTKLQGRAL